MFLMQAGKRFEFSFAAGSQGQANLPAIGFIGQSPQVFFRHQPVHQPDGAVVQDLEAFRQFADMDVVAPGKTLDGQQGLMLLRRDAGRLGGLLAETQELPQRVAEFGQRFVIGF